MILAATTQPTTGPSPFAEFMQDYGPAIARHTAWHFVLSFTAMLIACAIAIPLGVALSRCRSRITSNVIIGIISIIQPIPSLAFVAITAVVFTYLGPALGVKLPTIGAIPGLVALVAYALLPILRNTFTGLQQVDPTVKEVARGMGMKPGQVLLRVELPLALPFIVTGIRIATVWTIGVATLVSLVGAGGLGDLIIVGLQRGHMNKIMAGTIPAVALAICLDALLTLTERWLTPKGLRAGGPQGL